MSRLQQIGRLALRVEGETWVAYYALNETMDGALRLGTLAMRIARNPARKAQFMGLMREAIADIIEQEIGERPEWTQPIAAPEAERAGRG